VSLPSGCPAVTVHTGPCTDAEGNPYAGSLVITPSTPVVWTATGQVLLAGPIYRTLDDTGSTTTVLPATDATGLTVQGFTYTFTWLVRSASGGVAEVVPVTAQLPQAAPVVNLGLLAQMTSSTGVTVGLPAVLSVAGLSGTITAGALASALGLGSAAYTPASAYDVAGAAAAAQAAAQASGLQESANLSDLSSASTARSNLGLGSAALQPASAFDAAGAATTAVATETSRAQAAEALLAPLASPALTGTPTAPTAAPGTNSTRLATTAYTDAAVAVEATRATTAEAAAKASAIGAAAGIALALS
jgi:hypothetical protein